LREIDLRCAATYGLASSKAPHARIQAVADGPDTEDDVPTEGCDA
jgi:hypothetical protein